MSEVPTFIDRCLQGSATPDQIDDYVTRWHGASSPRGLRESLGMTPDEYARWMRDANALHDILAARKAAS